MTSSLLGSLADVALTAMFSCAPAGNTGDGAWGGAGGGAGGVERARVQGGGRCSRAVGAGGAGGEGGAGGGRVCGGGCGLVGVGGGGGGGGGGSGLVNPPGTRPPSSLTL